MSLLALNVKGFREMPLLSGYISPNEVKYFRTLHGDESKCLHNRKSCCRTNLYRSNVILHEVASRFRGRFTACSWRGTRAGWTRPRRFWNFAHVSQAYLCILRGPFVLSRSLLVPFVFPLNRIPIWQYTVMANKCQTLNSRERLLKNRCSAPFLCCIAATI